MTWEHYETIGYTNKKESGSIADHFHEDEHKLPRIGWVDRDIPTLFSVLRETYDPKALTILSHVDQNYNKANEWLYGEIEKKLTNILPSALLVTFDGCSSGGTQFLFLFAVRPYSGTLHENSWALLSPCFPLRNVVSALGLTRNLFTTFWDSTGRIISMSHVISFITIRKAEERLDSAETISSHLSARSWCMFSWPFLSRTRSYRTSFALLWFFEDHQGTRSLSVTVSFLSCTFKITLWSSLEND